MRFHKALVTGATSGIGQSLCHLLSQKEVTLLATGRDVEKLEALQKELGLKVTVKILPADLATIDGQQKIIRWIHQEGPDLIINNAGFGLYGEALSYTTEEQVKILRVNAEALLCLTLEAARTLITDSRSGVIVNISSAAGFQSLSYSAVYAASKAFVNSFSQSLDFELQSKGVRVLTLAPGMVDTDFQRRAGGKIQAKEKGVMTPEFIAEEVWKQIQTGQTMRIVNWMYRFLTILSTFIPKHIIAKFSKKVFDSRIVPRNFIPIDKQYDN